MVALNSDSKGLIWLCGLGYFAFYAPYSGLIKLLSSGSLVGDQQLISGFVLLPATLITTALTLVGFLLVSGWWRHAARRTLFGLRLPAPGLWPALSGLGTASIIATTTLAYTFEGVSIVLALLLMRGGVLIMSPVIDRVFGRTVHWYSWAALALSLIAILVALLNVASTVLGLAVGLNLLCYLLGYVVRLQSMTRVAKSDHGLVSRRYLVEEQLVSIPALLLVPFAIAWFGSGALSDELRLGFSSFLISGAALPAYGIGILYACLFVFGSLIYLDRRENTFCVPVNRCSSLLAGIAASLVLTTWFDQPPVSASQLTGATLIIFALLVLGFGNIESARQTGRKRLPQALPARRILFVCKGNTSRSPMAAAICRDLMVNGSGEAMPVAGAESLEFESAGLTANVGQLLSGAAGHALRQLGVAVPVHAAQNLTPEMVDRAAVIFCMTDGQRREIARRFPDAAPRTRCLDPEEDIADPAGGEIGEFRICAEQIREALERQLPRLGLTTVS